MYHGTSGVIDHINVIFEHGQYDFPQKKPGTMLAMYMVGALMGNKKLKAKAGTKMNKGMIASYKKLLR